MGRKPNHANEEAQLQVVQNRDILQRLNFLYQANLQNVRGSTTAVDCPTYFTESTLSYDLHGLEVCQLDLRSSQS